MKVVVSNKDITSLQGYPGLICVADGRGRVDRRPAPCVTPCGKRSGVGRGALENVTPAKYRTM